MKATNTLPIKGYRHDADAYHAKRNRERMKWLENEYHERKDSLRKVRFDLKPANRGIDYLKTKADLEKESLLLVESTSIETELIRLYQVLNINVNSQINFE